MRVALKVVPHILLFWPVMSEVDVVGFAVRVEPSCFVWLRACLRLVDLF